MQHPRSAYCGLAIALVAGVAVLGGEARAASIPFTESSTFSVNPAATGQDFPSTCCDQLNVIHAAPATATTITYTQSGSWGSVDSFASANLATGQLKTRTAVVSADGTANPYLQTNALFGDSFTTTTAGGAPFTWAANSQARFSISLDGTLSSSSPLPELGPEGFVILSILQKGTLDPNKPLINGPTAQQYFYWNIGNPNAQIFYTDQQGNSQLLTPTGSYLDVPSTLTASFNPGGDFDWVLLLGASGQIGGVDTSFDIDLSHTLTLSYAGPDGSVTQSGSGLFGNFDATLPPTSVPEPSMLLLFPTAALLLAARRGAGGAARAA